MTPLGYRSSSSGWRSGTPQGLPRASERFLHLSACQPVYEPRVEPEDARYLFLVQLLSGGAYLVVAARPQVVALGVQAGELALVVDGEPFQLPDQRSGPGLAGTGLGEGLAA
jgi:hypothetical protein